jgi:hypothetical protein
MNFFLFLVAIIFTSGCMQHDSEINYTRHKSRLIDEIGNKVFKELKKEKELYPLECGGRMMNQITLLHLGFKYYKSIEIEQAREILISAGNLLLKTINENEQIRPYLNIHPFTYNNIGIEIFINNSDNLQFDSKNLSVISLNQGLLQYDIHPLETKKLTTIYSETYEEAIEKLKSTVGI